MRHRKVAAKLGRDGSHRKAMYRNLVTSLLQHERVETTDAKAKQVRRLAERMITLGKRGDLHARRRALRVVRTRDVCSKLFSDLADRYRERPGGYTRVVKRGRRVGDAAAMSIVELVEGGASAPEPAPAKRKKRAPRAKAEGGRRTAASRKEADTAKAKAPPAKPARPRRSRKKAEGSGGSSKKKGS